MEKDKENKIDNSSVQEELIRQMKEWDKKPFKEKYKAFIDNSNKN